YLVHMRYPVLFYRQLGLRRFLGFQAHFVTALSMPFMAPILWSFWLVLFGLPHPLDPVVARSTLMTVGVLFLALEIVNMSIGFAAVIHPKHRHLIPWVPTLHLYWPLSAIAAYKALYELILKPFFWDKTQHGLSLKHVSQNGKAASAKALDLA
ncbi:MAG: glycosyl transferase, partial [Pseudomonadota bacterium]